MKYVISFLMILSFNYTQAQQPDCSKVVCSTFTPVNSSYKTISGSEVVVPNMPRIRSQDSMGLCYAFAPATLLQKHWCDEIDEKNCAGIDNTETISPITLSGRKDTIKGKTNANDRSSFAHAYFTKITDAGGDANSVLQHATYSSGHCAESNFPFDQFVGLDKFHNLNYIKSNEETKKVVEPKIDGLRTLYNKYRPTGDKLTTTEAQAIESCTECLSEANKLVSIPIKSIDTLRYSLKKDTFEEFIFSSFFLSCKKTVDFIPPVFGSYPEKDIPIDKDKFLNDINYPPKVALLNQIKKLVNLKIPLQISGIATDYKLQNGSKKYDLESGHVTVISGYKKVCDSSNECHDMLKIHNSWGMDWQDRTNGGWVVADEVLKSAMSIHRKGVIQADKLAWVSPKAIK